MNATTIRLQLYVQNETISAIKSESEKRNRNGAGKPWTWRELAAVKAAILLDEWAKEMSSKQKEGAAC